MKLLVTDYDKTLKTSIKNLNLNVKAIEQFRKNGNKFAIATGRCFGSIKREITKYNVEYDYLICNNGLIIFDSKDNVLTCSTLSNQDLNNIYSILNMNSDINLLKLYNFYESTSNFKDILEIYVNFKSRTCAKEYKKYLEDIIPGIYCYRDRNILFIGNQKNKSIGVSFLQKLEQIEKSDIYTVGDNLNDISMLENFKGYKMIVSHPSLWLKPIPITKEVHTLVKKINR